MKHLGRKRAIFAVFACLAACFSFAQQRQDPITVSYEAIWNGLSTDLEYLPVRLTVSNTGKPEYVEVKWVDGDTEVVTFFDMPTGATKQRDIYLSNDMGYGVPEIKVRRGFVDVPMTIELGMGTNYGSMKVGIISDVLALQTAFNEDKPNQFENKAWAAGFGVGVAKPGYAPTRSIGYQDLRVLILGEGAERLTDDEVTAIKRAVLAGMRLVFNGGTIQPVLNDPRWSEFLPVVPGAEVKSVRAPTEFKRFANKLPGMTPMLTSSAKPGASVLSSGSDVVLASQPMGAGAVSFVAYDMFGSGWKDWGGRYALLYEFSTRKVSGSWIEYFNDIDSSNDYGYGYYTGYDENEPSADVFGIKVPSSGRIFMVLLGYFVLVVPVNFLVLRKLKRGELAWFSAPLIALGAAGVLFAFAGQLYSAKASRYASGWLIGSEGSEDAVFMGKQQLFFPGTGRYDLGLESVEFVGSTAYSEFNMWGQQSVQNRFLDMGSVVSPAYEVSNLSFREFELRQNVAMPAGWVSSRWDAGRGVCTGKIQNPFDEPLEGVQVNIGAKVHTVGEIEPGQTVDFEVKAVSNPEERVWVDAKLSGKSFGSNFGDSVGSGSVNLLYTIRPEVGR